MNTSDDDATVEYLINDDSSIDRLVAGRYRLRALVGRGGMASVYRADDESLGRTVAVKLFHPGLAQPQDVRRQREEIMLLAGLNHPGLVTLFDAASDGDESFLIMEFVEGDDLRARMQGGALDSQSTALIGADIAGALAYIHAQGVVHRDVKPANILLSGVTGGSHPAHAKLADFGIARIIESTHLTAAGSLIGTASFLSPEQAEGREVGAASDIYSLGLTLLECLTGERAFPGTAVESAFARLHRDPTVPFELGSSWVELLGSATAREATVRPNASEFARILRELTDSEATRVLPATTTVRTNDPEQTQLLTATMGPTETLRVPPRADRLQAGRKPVGRSRLIGAAVAAALIVATLVLWSTRSGQLVDAGTGSQSPGTTISYPAVDGDLGVHLNQLQESVAP